MTMIDLQKSIGPTMEVFFKDSYIKKKAKFLIFFPSEYQKNKSPLSALTLFSINLTTTTASKLYVTVHVNERGEGDDCTWPNSDHPEETPPAGGKNWWRHWPTSCDPSFYWSVDFSRNLRVRVALKQVWRKNKKKSERKEKDGEKKQQRL